MFRGWRNKLTYPLADLGGHSKCRMKTGVEEANLHLTAFWRRAFKAKKWGHALIVGFFYSFEIFKHTVCEVKVTQSCLTLWDPMDYIVHRILQARILEWVAFPFSSRSSRPRDWTQVSHTAGGFFTSWATREAHTGVGSLSLLQQIFPTQESQGSPALQADSLPTELGGKPTVCELPFMLLFPFSHQCWAKFG